MLGIKFWGYDGAIPKHFLRRLKATTHCIIATPTDTHTSIIRMVKELSPEMPILCEKPICKNLEELDSLINLKKVYMVNNYQYTPQGRQETYKGPVVYDYYHSGKDSLAWDCIQLFKFDSDVTLSNKSPIWHCEINGERLSRDSIDTSYVNMIKDFTGKRERMWGSSIFLKLHRRVVDYEKAENEDSDWHPGKV
jgi:hypothetical protein